MAALTHLRSCSAAQYFEKKVFCTAVVLPHSQLSMENSLFAKEINHINSYTCSSAHSSDTEAKAHPPEHLSDTVHHLFQIFERFQP